MAEPLSLSFEMYVVLSLLVLTIVLFIFEVVRVDVVGLTIISLLGLLSAIPGLENLIDPQHLFDGFGSNAVISIIAVMIIGAGLDRTGIMGRVASWILSYGGQSEFRIMQLVSATVSSISSFMQNVGAAALFLPVVSRISTRTRIPLSRLLMPMGFCAICGGTLTMVGSSPLILLNDLLASSNKALPADQQMQSFHLLSVTPIGLALVISCILYFMFLGNKVIPKGRPTGGEQQPINPTEYFENNYGLSGNLFEARVTSDSPLIGLSIEEIEVRYNIPYILALSTDNEIVVAPPRDQIIWVNSVLGLMGSAELMDELANEYGLAVSPELHTLANTLDYSQAGVAEIVIPPSSTLVGNTIRDLRLRKTFGLSVLRILRGGNNIDTMLRDETLLPGDTLVVHTSWSDLHALSRNRSFVIITDHPQEELRPHKMRWALICFCLSLSLVMFTSLPISSALLTGAVGMILSGVVRIEEAYTSVDWRTVFLLACLIPLGLAVETTGTAAWLSQQILWLMGDVTHWQLQATMAILATLFTLVMSNVGATVLLVPLAVNIAIATDADPAMFALTVAICATNSFLIPTHPVNALIMGPAGYRTRDFILAGALMSIIYLCVSLTMLNLIF